MIRVQEQSNGSIVYEKKEDMTDIGWILDQGTQKTFNAATVKYGAGSTKAENTFAYSGDGHIIINGGSGSDKITTGENEINTTYFEIAGGDGYDTYYLTDGDNFKIVDSGANRIYKEDEDGGYFSVGNLYKITTDDIWVSADGSSKISHNSPWTITFEDGSSVGLDSSFQSGDYGINLIEVPDKPKATNTIL
ncbi:MAG: hypothetical protein RBR63_11600, partial [Methanosarcina vacuolata]|nr:hypothetical protein [Methanosarcina vacuolata]